MKNSFLQFFCLAILFLQVQNTTGQTTGINYAFSQPAGTLSFNNSTAGSITLIAGGTDDQLVSFAAPTTWGGFYFGGVWFPQSSTSFNVSSNGWVSFSNQGSSLPANSLASAPLTIAPLWDDLKVHANGEVTYKIIGGATSRALIIEWRGMYWDHNAADTAISFQVILFDNAQAIVANRNAIEFRYKRNGNDTDYVNNLSNGSSIGISGFCNGDIFAFTSAAGAPSKLSPEVSNILSKPSDSLRHRFKPVSHPNDECTNAETITFNPNYFLITSIGTTLQSTQSIAALPACGAPASVSDIWYTFTKPSNITNFEIFTDSLDCRGAYFKTGLEVYTSCAGAPLSCDFGSSGPAGLNASSYLNFTNQSCTPLQYWVRVYSADTSYRGYFRFNIRPPGHNCSNALDITPCGIPYSSAAASTTCGFGFDYDSTNSQPHSSINSGEDYVYAYTPPLDICVDFFINNTFSYETPGLFIYEGCPTSGTCIGFISKGGYSGLTFKNISLSAGLTYYFVVDNDSSSSTSCTFFDFGITLSSGGPSTNDVCASAQNLQVVSATSCTGIIDYNNNCATPTNAGVVQPPLCGIFTDGVTPDVWFTFTSSGTSTHRVTVEEGTSASAQDLAMAVYTGTCAGMTLVNCDDNSNTMMPSLSVFPSAAGTIYYMRIWSNNGTQPGNFRVCVVDGCSPANDFCSGAIPLVVGHYTQGDNTCASGINEPFTDTSATCWTNIGGVVQLNTVWYSFVATNTTMKIRIHLLSLHDSQIALYSSSGGCGGNFIELSCNDNAVSPCFLYNNTLSQINANGLSIGSTYFIRVDGVNENTGTFEIIVLDGLSILPPILAQDCPLAINLCNNNQIIVQDHTYKGEGNICDVLPWATCLQNGDYNGVFYKFSVTGTGFGNFAEFTITPNGIGNCDFRLWCIDTIYGIGNQVPAVPNYCSALNNMAAFPGVICNYSASRITGCNRSSGTITFPGYYTTTSTTAPGMSPALYVPSGMTATFLLLVTSDYHGNGFTLDWMGTPINSTPPSLLWLNANNSNWNDSSNWVSTGCSIPGGNVPDCNNQIPANILAGNTMPIFSANTLISDISIDPGASITINPGVTLEVCGNFNNNGTINYGPGSTIKFFGNRNTGISGFPINFGNFELAKDSGAMLTLGSNIIINGYDSIYGGILNNNGVSTSVGRNFYNYNGNSSYTGFGNLSAIGTLTFKSPNGAPQHFRNDGSTLSLYNLTMSQTIASSLILDTNSTSDLVIGPSGHLTLTKGKIITGNLREVKVMNKSNVACLAGTSQSYVEGNLRREIDTTASNYEFPVGNSTKGYQRFSVQFTTPPATPYNILSRFNQWPMLPIAPPDSECMGMGYNSQPVFDNGYWTLEASDSIGLGTYNAHAYPLNENNRVGSCFSIMKSASNNGQGPWSMEGLQTVTSAYTHVIRDSLSSFSDFAVVQDFGILADVDDESNSVGSTFNFFVYPNPASNTLTVSINSVLPQSYILNMVDVTGRIVLKKNISVKGPHNSFAINIQDIAKGIYLIKLGNENQQEIEQLIIQ